MRITEFDDINLAINFHNELNPKLWENDALRPEVRKTLLRIADDFKDFLGIDIYDLVDITISGSNAAYTYTPTSDIDLHLVVMIPDAHEAELKELFDAKKYQYNDMHNIKVRGFDVELYVQDAEDEHHSMGIYSVKRDAWISKPKRQRADIKDIEVQEKYECMQHRINSAIVGDNYDKALKVWQDIKNLRKTGLAQGGEFSPENLAFKILRVQGYLGKLRKHLGNLRDDDLGLLEADTEKKQPEVYLDMDGVLADFFTEYAKLAGMKSGNYRDIPPAKTDPTLQKMVGTDFFARLPKFPTADALVKLVTGIFGHYHICSSPLRGDHEGSEKYKRVWINRHLNPKPVDIIITPKKEKWAVQADGTPNILIDDRGNNITAWEAAGGIGIKYQADEDSLDVVKNGLKRAFEIINREREHEPQVLISKDRSLPVATSKDLNESTYSDNKSIIDEFTKWVVEKLKITSKLPKIVFADAKEGPGQDRTGYYNYQTNVLWVYTGRRNVVDILRTVAHELAHHKQRETMGDLNSHRLSKIESQADETAGMLVKIYIKSHPEIVQ